MAGKHGTIHRTLLKRATRRNGARNALIHTALDPDELRRFEAWRHERGLTRAQGMRYLILVANAFNATHKSQHRKRGAHTNQPASEQTRATGTVS